LHVIDISDPANPRQVSNRFKVLDGMASGNYAYLTLCGEAGLQIIDISDPPI
jgi:hypothetical protein